MAKGKSVETRRATPSDQIYVGTKSKGNSKLATTPIPVMTDDESKAATARDFNVTGGQQRTGAESDTEIDTGTTDIGDVGGKPAEEQRPRTKSGPTKGRASRSGSNPGKRKGQAKKTESGAESGNRGKTAKGAVGESEVAKSDSGDKALLTDASEGTSAASGSESKLTSESAGTSARSKTKEPEG